MDFVPTYSIVSSKRSEVVKTEGKKCSKYKLKKSAGIITHL